MMMMMMTIVVTVADVPAIGLGSGCGSGRAYTGERCGGLPLSSHTGELCCMTRWALQRMTLRACVCAVD